MMRKRSLLIANKLAGFTGELDPPGQTPQGNSLYTPDKHSLLTWLLVAQRFPT
jgi:hypothetical protein